MKGTLKIPWTFEGIFNLDSVVSSDNPSAFIKKGNRVNS